MGPVMSATENHYEDIGPDSDIVRNMIRTESQVLFLLKKILASDHTSAIDFLPALRVQNISLLRNYSIFSDFP